MASIEKRAAIVEESLFQRYDVVNALWIKGEEVLTNGHIPHDVEFEYYYPTNAEEADCDPLAKYLGVIKKNGVWRLCHGERPYNSPSEDTRWTPIIDCSAFTRVRMAKYFPHLQEAVVAASERFVPKVDEAIALLRKALDVDSDGSLAELLAERAKLNGQHPKK